jgi:ComF family protein
MNIKHSLKQTFNDFLHLFYPYNCIGCGTDVVNDDQQLCFNCFSELPFTHFEDRAANPVEKIFYGRSNIEQAAAVLYFTKHSIVQRLLFELKYKSNRNAGLFLGRLIGNAMMHSERFQNIDLLVPMPLNERRLKQRGYNQADILIAGIQEKISIASSSNAVIRSLYTQTQTHKDRTARWQSMEHVFKVADQNEITDKHILIVDDVITTGATMEALANCIHSHADCRISVISAAWTSQ